MLAIFLQISSLHMYPLRNIAVAMIVHKFIANEKHSLIWNLHLQCHSPTDNMRVAQSLKFLAFLSKVLKDFPAFFLTASLMKQFVNSLHSDRASFQLSVVHGAPGTSVQFGSYFKICQLVGECGGVQQPAPYYWNHLTCVATNLACADHKFRSWCIYFRSHSRDCLGKTCKVNTTL